MVDKYIYSRKNTMAANNQDVEKKLNTENKNTYSAASNQLLLSSMRTDSGGGNLDELHSKITQRIDSRKNNTGLPDDLKAGMETLSGFNLDDVRVHYNSSKPVQLNSDAYTIGTNIHVAPGQEKHLPHEAWHVVQQKQGRVRPIFRSSGVDINNDPSLEREADINGKLSLKGAEPAGENTGADIFGQSMLKNADTTGKYSGTNTSGGVAQLCGHLLPPSNLRFSTSNPNFGKYSYLLLSIIPKMLSEDIAKGGAKGLENVAPTGHTSISTGKATIDKNGISVDPSKVGGFGTYDKLFPAVLESAKLRKDTSFPSVFSKNSKEMLYHPQAAQLFTFIKDQETADYLNEALSDGIKNLNPDELFYNMNALNLGDMLSGKKDIKGRHNCTSFAFNWTHNAVENVLNSKNHSMEDWEALNNFKGISESLVRYIVKQNNARGTHFGTNGTAIKAIKNLAGHDNDNQNQNPKYGNSNYNSAYEYNKNTKLWVPKKVYGHPRIVYTQADHLSDI